MKYLVLNELRDYSGIIYHQRVVLADIIFYGSETNNILSRLENSKYKINEGKL